MSIRRDDVDKFYDYNIHIPSRTLYLGTEVDERMAKNFLKGLHLLEQAGTAGITIILNSIGGDEYHGMAIYDAIQHSHCHITIIVYGQAMSMGSWILQAADERIIAPHATLLLHYGSWTAEGTDTEVRASYKELERLNTLMEDAYLSRMTDMTRPKLKKLLEPEWYLTAAEAVRVGLADKVMTKDIE